MPILYTFSDKHKIFLACKYNNFVIQFKCNVKKCNNYDEHILYQEKHKKISIYITFLKWFNTPEVLKSATMSSFYLP